MSQAEEKPKRVVSKAEYVGHAGIKAGLYSLVGGMCLFGVVGIAFSLFLFYVGMIYFASEIRLCLLFVFVSLFLGTFSTILIKMGWQAAEEVGQIEPVLPFSQHTADQIPARESLVRAASDPIQPQDELLRAAHGGQETPPEQLLRPITEQEQTL